MSLHRWGLSVVGFVLILALYFLPRVVVDNDPDLMEINVNEVDETDTHSFDVSKDDRQRITSLRKLIFTSPENKKNTIFADSLANLYLRYNQLDSAAWYARALLEVDSSIDNQLLAGDIFFKAYGFSTDQEKARLLANEAAICFEKVNAIEQNPDIEAKIAMTKVVTSNPMAGIMMLRRILDEYPENKTALYSMGVLSMQSGQYDKAVERFKKLVSIDEANVQAAYYLAVSYFENGNKELATKWFTKLKIKGSDPAVKISVENYLKRLKEP